MPRSRSRATLVGVLLLLAPAARGAVDAFDAYLDAPFPAADGFDFPVGDEDGNGSYQDAAGRTHAGWYVATQFGERYSLGLHTGEDWNGRGGGNTDLGQPVHAIGAGKVVAAAAMGEPWGNVVVIEHLVYENGDRRRVRSLYAHLSRLDVRAGEVVQRRRVIGAVGRDPEGRFPAHLHLEVRTDLSLPPTYWPSSDGRDLAWIQARYLAPGDFIRARRRLFVPAREPVLALVDVARHRLRLYHRGKPAGEFEVAFGQAAGCKERRRDLRTPCGMYFVVDRSTGPFSGDYAAFYGGYWIKFNYPNTYDARRGAARGEVGRDAAEAISSEWAARRPTRQDTALGGGIGLHSWASEWDAADGVDKSWGCLVAHPRDAPRLYRELTVGAMVVIF